MTELRDMADKRGVAVLHFDPRKLKVKPGLNIRDLTTPDNRAHVEWLAGEIEAKGFSPEHPLIIFKEDETPYISQGHCRHAALMLCIERGVNILTVPCLPEAKGTSERDRIAGQFTSNAGKSLNPREAAANIKRMLRLGLSADQVARAIGKSASYISQTLEFEAAPAEAHDAVASGEISKTLAASILREEGPAKGVETIRKAVRTAKSQGKAKATAKHLPKPEPAQALRFDPAKVKALIAMLVDAARAGNEPIRRILDEAGFGDFAPLTAELEVA